MLTTRLGRQGGSGSACRSALCGPSTSRTAAAAAAAAAAAFSTAPSRLRAAKHKTGMTPQKRAALRRAQQFAKGVEQNHAAVENASTVAESAPEATSSVSFAPRVADLEGLFPERPPVVSRPSYPKHHAKLFAEIDKAFLRNQLVLIASELPTPIHCRREDTKSAIIQSIMNAYKWPVPRSPEDYTLKTQEFPLTAAEVFLLNRDQRATDYLAGFEGVRLMVNTMETPGMYLFSVTALPADLVEVDRFFHYRREAYVHLEWTVQDMQGFEPSPTMLWQIASVTGAYVERTPKGTYLATGATMMDVQRARGMAQTAGVRVNVTHPPLSAILPDPHPSGAEHYYALTPHVPSMSAPLPWDTAAAVAERPLFRLTRTTGGEWPSVREAHQKAALMDVAQVVAFGPEADSSVTPTSFSRLVDDALASVPEIDSAATESVVVQFGHLLSPSDLKSVLTPPIKGAWTLHDKDAWSDLPPPLFTPAVPPVLIREPLSGVKRIRRLTYRRAGADDRMTVAYGYPIEKPVMSLDPPTVDDQPAWFQQLGTMLPELEKRGRDDEDDFQIDDIHALLGDNAPKPESEAKLRLFFSIGNEATTDVLLPERPVDARVRARVARDLPQSEVPHELTKFFSELHEHPTAREVPLSDFAVLRRGKGPEAPAAAAAEEESHDDDISFFRTEETVNAEADVVAEELEPAPAPTPVPPPAAPTEAPVRQMPRSVGSEPEGAAILPPLSVLYAREMFYLERDEVLDVAEEVRKVRLAPEVASNEMEGGAPEVPMWAPAHEVTLRSVAMVDLRGPGGVVRYGELEAAGKRAALWAELASVTREPGQAPKPSRVTW